MKKSKNFIERSQEEEKDEEGEEVMKSAVDFIEDIICCNKISKSLLEEEVVIKIRHLEDKVFFF